MARTIFDITDDMLALGDLLDKVGGDVTDPEVDESILAWSEELEADLQSKVENYCWLMKEKEARAAAMMAEADRLKERAQVNKNAAKGLKDRLLWVFENRGIDKVETDHFRVAVTKNGGKIPMDIDPDGVPKMYQATEVVTTIDKDKIRHDLEAGADLDFAVLLERGTHLRVK
jgi:replicative superfamily II helicase